jgi:hypothetical protein
MRIDNFVSLLCLATAPNIMACPKGQHQECVLPRPWGGCAQKICVPDSANPLDALQDMLDAEALKLAMSAKENDAVNNRQDCVVMVAAGLAVWGTIKGGPIAGLASGAAGAAAANMACRKVFPV